MHIIDIPKEFQPSYNSNYPPYSSGKNIEEIFYDYFLKNNDDIESEYIYIPVFWTSYYIINNYAANIEQLYNWLDTIDKTKKYFTVVQYDSGIFIKNYNLNIMVFTAGGGGLNINNNEITEDVIFNGFKRQIFSGKKGDYDIPLICLPVFPEINIEKDIFCSFMGRFDTHPSRMKIKDVLNNNNKYLLSETKNVDEYKNIINRSTFTIAPRGYGYTSFRLYEAINANSIPIYIWENKISLPFQDKINWNDFAIIVNSNDIAKLPEILNNANIEKMQHELTKIKHMFSFDYTFKYIIEKISVT